MVQICSISNTYNQNIHVFLLLLSSLIVTAEVQGYRGGSQENERCLKCVNTHRSHSYSQSIPFIFTHKCHKSRTQINQILQVTSEARISAGYRSRRSGENLHCVFNPCDFNLIFFSTKDLKSEIFRNRVEYREPFLSTTYLL